LQLERLFSLLLCHYINCSLNTFLYHTRSAINSTMARKNCNHPVFPSLRARLVANNIHECPTCRVRLHVCEIEEVQAALKRRSGVFESRTKAREAEEKKNNSERLIHSALVKRWRLAKIGIYNDLSLFEELRVEGATWASWILQLDKAFELWEEVKDDCCSVPGYMYLQEAVQHVESDEEDKEVQSVDYSQKQGTTPYSKIHLIG
jgi:hypothetical protein